MSKRRRATAMTPTDAYEGCGGHSRVRRPWLRLIVIERCCAYVYVTVEGGSRVIRSVREKVKEGEGQRSLAGRAESSQHASRYREAARATTLKKRQCSLQCSLGPIHCPRLGRSASPAEVHRGSVCGRERVGASATQSD